MSVVRNMFYGSFGTQNSMVTFMSKCGPMKGQYQVRLFQIRWNSQFSSQKWLYCLVLSQDSKSGTYFYVRQQEMPEIAFQKVISSPLPVLWAIAQTKARILFWYFACVLFICILIILFWLLDNLKILDFIGNYSWKIKMLSFGIFFKKLRHSFVERIFYAVWIFCLRVTSKLYITLSGFKHMPFFTQNVETWHHQNAISSKKSRRFSEILERRQTDAGEGTVESIALISIAVFELSRKTGRGAESDLPPKVRRLTDFVS